MLPADGDRADANGLPTTTQAWVDVTEVTSEALAISEPARMSERDVAYIIHTSNIIEDGANELPGLFRQQASLGNATEARGPEVRWVLGQLL